MKILIILILILVGFCQIVQGQDSTGASNLSLSDRIKISIREKKPCDLKSLDDYEMEWSIYLNPSLSGMSRSYREEEHQNFIKLSMERDRVNCEKYKATQNKELTKRIKELERKLENAERFISILLERTSQ